MKNHLLFKNVYEAFYKSKSEKIFQSVHQQSNFLEKSAIDINPILVPFFHIFDVIICHSRPPNSRTRVVETQPF